MFVDITLLMPSSMKNNSTKVMLEHEFSTYSEIYLDLRKSFFYGTGNLGLECIGLKNFGVRLEMVVEDSLFRRNGRSNGIQKAQGSIAAMLQL